jgi:ParB-like chromosome segregation protein Spo0J
MKVMNLAALVLDPRLQSRVEINEDTVAEYATDIESGDQFPPVIVFFDSTHFYLADGYHRYYGHKRAGKVSIQCEVINGTIRDAIYYSTAVNAKHGMRRSYADRRKAVMTLLEDFEWSLKSNTEIAKHVGVSVSFVSNLRNSSGKMPDKIEYTTPSGNKQTKTTASGRPRNTEKKEDKPKDPAPETATKDSSVVDAHNELIETLTKENAELTQQLAVSGMEGTEEEKKAASELIADLTEQLRIAEIEIVSLKGSRDRFQNECAQLKKQVAAQQRQLKKYEQ